MSDRKLFIVGNPYSGKRKLRKVIQNLSSFLNARNISYELHDTEASLSAEKTVADKLDTSFTDLIIVGGDGTINEAVNGLRFDIPVSIIPAGTGNDFVKMINIGNSMKDHFETAIDGQIKNIDLGVCNNRKFVNGIGIGFDGQIVEDMAEKKVALLSGHAAYYYHVIRILAGFRERSFSYNLDQKQYKKDLILLTIGNGSTFGGGFKLMPNALLDDGLLEVCEIGELSGLKRFLNIHKLSNGSHESLNSVNFYQATSVTVEKNDLLFAHIDGERMGQPPYEIKTLSKALRIRVC
ncbi:MAG: diacylglycerol kinase family protein [Ekhidna sp.]